ncbi:Ubiquitin carboxyl-terminal hydrolase, putative [Hondaea fermentalgiana]|uniref:Ubiquitin carboxyl-terminal hydrolase n=1 Tax=Hondaea fermentalgiana TaxID=2315210 RepID=A0A2R5GDI2_9STRA|nr:Ubiquitin carboxyl-terminal hydrolase, putative [Hondaea fermentalgiana]|eukprot:GBG27778.1 Ubiquitin carboxyl-terminal hydrolase, putative [Hondaea fermentalgiana]
MSTLLRAPSQTSADDDDDDEEKGLEPEELEARKEAREEKDLARRHRAVAQAAARFRRGEPRRAGEKRRYRTFEAGLDEEEGQCERAEGEEDEEEEEEKKEEKKKNGGEASSSKNLAPTLRHRSSSWENQFQPGLTKEFIRLRKESLWTPGNELGAGLRNLGNTCFMNAALQCLSHTAPLTDFFVGTLLWQKDVHRENPNGTGGKLAEAFAALLSDLFAESSNKQAINPRAFKNTVSRFAPQFSGTRQHDCQEFMSYLLDGLHEDLNRVSKKPYNEIPDANGRPDEVVAAEQWKLHLLRNRSIIVDIMQGQLKSTLTCQTCGFVSVKFDPFMYLSLPVSAAATSTEKTGGDAAEVDLDALLEAFLEPEELTGDEQWFCSKCKKHVDAVKKFDLWKLPPVLIIHLKRFKYSRLGIRTQKLNTLVRFPLQNWDLEGHTFAAQRDHPTYDLYAVSRHMGGAGSGHYNAIVRGRSAHQWTLFDDARRSTASESNVQDRNAYLLFFQRRAMADVGYRRQSVSNPSNWPHKLPANELEIIVGDAAASSSGACTTDASFEDSTRA